MTIKNVSKRDKQKLILKTLDEIEEIKVLIHELQEAVAGGNQMATLATVVLADFMGNRWPSETMGKYYKVTGKTAEILGGH